MPGRIPYLYAAILILVSGSASAASYDDANTPEGWAWQRIRNDQIADFAQRVPPGGSRPCGQTDPQKMDANNNCGSISAQFLVDALTIPQLQAQIGRHGLRVGHARVQGSIDLTDADVPSEVWLIESRVEGGINATGSSWKRQLALSGTTIANDLNFRSADLKSYVLLNNAKVSGPVDFSSATIDGNLVMSGASFARDVGLNHAAISGGLFLRDKTTIEGKVDLVNATIGGNLELRNSSFSGSLLLQGIEVKGGLYLSSATFGADVSAPNAIIDGAVEMVESSFSRELYFQSADLKSTVSLASAKFGGNVDFNGVTIGGSLDTNGASFARDLYFQSANLKSYVFLGGNTKFAGKVSFNSARIGENLNVSGASFAGDVGLNHVKVGGGLFLRNKTQVAGEVNAVNATIGGNLELENSFFAGPLTLEGIEIIQGALILDGATASTIRLPQADIRYLVLRGLGWWCPGGKSIVGGTANNDAAMTDAKPAHWPLGDPHWQDAHCKDAAGPIFDLSNAHVGAFQDSPDAWPPTLSLEGFHYDRLGSGAEGNDMRLRTTPEWSDWIARDPTFSTQPYTQLSSVLLGAGRRESSEEIEFAGRERERHQVKDWLSWIWLTFLWAISGYGIGSYTFRVLIPVLLLTLFGAFILRLSPQARPRNLLWRLGASLHRLLPVIELSKEFTNLFDSLPEQEFKRPFYKSLVQIYFAGHAIAGYVLSFILIAAMGGLTQKV
jgi:hypothetical protein